MDAQSWAPLVMQGIGIAIMVGMYLQQHKDYDRRLRAVEDGKVDTKVFDVEVGRIDGNVTRLEQRVNRSPR